MDELIEALRNWWPHIVAVGGMGELNVATPRRRDQVSLVRDPPNVET